jgi:tetratricopeptide (TPR) repeat protein
MGEGPQDGAVATSPADPFVGRADGLAAIQTAVAGAATGRGSLVLIAGEAGIGKTRLASEAVRTGGQEHLVLWGSCSDGDGAPPFWPWTEALRPLIGTTALPPEVVALLPGLAPAGATPPVPVADEVRFRAFNLVADLLDDVGPRRPVVVVLDDLHWADPSSLELLRTVARRSVTSHVAVVGTYRDTDVDPGDPLDRLLADLVHTGPRLVLTGLAVDEVALLLGPTHGAVDDEVAAAVTQRTGGNPFFVREVGRTTAGVDDVPPAVRDVLLRRIDALPHPARAALEAMAVLGDVDVGLAAVVLDEDDPLAVLDALDELVHRRLLVRPGDGAPAFAHALVRETTLATLPARRTVELHDRAAGAIEARSGAAEVDAIAHHRILAAALDPEAAVHWAAVAGRAARRQLAYEQAVRWYERALVLVSPGTRQEAELLIELAESAGRTASGLDRGREAAVAAAEVARRLGDVELLARAAIAYSGPFLGILTAGFAEPEPVALAEEALLALPPEPSPLRARLLARVATGLGYTPDHQRALECAGQALDVARAAGGDTLVEALTAVTSIWNPADHPEAPALLDEFESASRAGRSREGLVTVTVNRCLLALEHGDRVELERQVAQLDVLLDELHLPVHGAYVGLFEAMLHRLDGRYAEAEAELLTTMVGLGDQAEGFVPGGAQLMVVWNEQDRLGEVLDDARRLFGSDRFRGVPSARVVLAYFEAAVGDRAVAAAELPPLAASWATTQRDPNWLQGLAWLCRTSVVLEDVESAAVLFDLGRPHADRSVFTAAGTITLGVLGMWLAEVALLLGRHDEAADLLDDAERHDRRLHDRGHLVECSWLRGRLAAATGRSDAAALLGAAAIEAEALGMARVARLARAAGSSTAPPAVTVAPPAAATFRREGDVWLLRFGGADARVRDTKGMADLAVLLARPGVEVHVAELVGAAGTADAPATGDALLDDTAIAAYRSRLRELTDEEDDADAAGDAERSLRARAEREAIVDQLAADLGLGGTARSAPDWVERARKAVRRRVDAALKRIEAEHEPAGRHLRRSVKTGVFCCYDPAEPVRWEA